MNADPAAFEAFYRRHVDRVIGFAARRLRDPADVADVVASTFVNALTRSCNGVSSTDMTVWNLLSFRKRYFPERSTQSGNSSSKPNF